MTETETASDIKSDLSYDSEFITVININTTKIFLDNEKAYFYMLELLETYDSNKDGHIYVTSESNMSFELTTDELEKKELNNEQIRDNLSMIDLDECETILRNSYKINETSHLILLKSENLNTIPSERNVQYEIFEPLNKTGLNLSLCEKSDINLYFQIELNSETEKLYKDLNKQGYDIFNINDPFYNDICTPYNTQNVTDMGCMFLGCYSLTNINLSNFNTQNVTDMRGMFYECKSLKKKNVITNDNKILNILK